jgi:hypothetical protein
MSHTDLGQPDLAALRAAAGGGARQGRIAVSWTTHDVPLSDQLRYRTYRDTHQAINAALGSILAFRCQAVLFGSGGAWLVTSRRAGGMEAGQ